MRVIRIDPYIQETQDIEVFVGNNGWLYELLSNEEHPIDCFERVLVGPGHYAYIDESGGLPHHNPTHFWKLPTTPWIAGMGVIIGETQGGEDFADCLIDGAIVAQFIEMKTLEEMDEKDLPSSNFNVISFDSTDDLLNYLEDQSKDGD